MKECYVVMRRSELLNGLVSIICAVSDDSGSFIAVVIRFAMTWRGLFRPTTLPRIPLVEHLGAGPVFRFLYATTVTVDDIAKHHTGALIVQTMQTVPSTT